MADIRDLAGYYCAMALGTEPDADLKAVFHDIRELKVGSATPVGLSFISRLVGRGSISKTVVQFLFRLLSCLV